MQVSNSRQVGASGTFSFEFEGLKEGEVELYFTYAREWEDKEPAKEVTYKFNVDKDGNITELVP